MVPLRNGWFDRYYYPEFCRVISEVSKNDPTRFLKNSKFKYLEIRVDMRTGDFIILDREGKQISFDELLEFFPELKD